MFDVNSTGRSLTLNTAPKAGILKPSPVPIVNYDVTVPARLVPKTQMRLLAVVLDMVAAIMQLALQSSHYWWEQREQRYFGGLYKLCHNQKNFVQCEQIPSMFVKGETFMIIIIMHNYSSRNW